MRTQPLHRLFLSALALVAFGSMAYADDVAMPAAAAAESSSAAPVNVPGRGISMAKVEAEFGAPAERHAAIGKPPITRWDYPNFSVFFEYDHVVHAVVH